MLVHGRHHELAEEQRTEMLQREMLYRKKQMPSNPLDPMFYHVYEDTLPDEQYYRLIPEGKLNSPWTYFEIYYLPSKSRWQTH